MSVLTADYPVLVRAPILVRSRPRLFVPLAVTAALAAISAIGWLDYRTGPEFGLGLLYLGPIVACAWWLGSAPAVPVAVVAAMVALVADLPPLPSGGPGMMVWEAFSRLVVFLGIALAVGHVRLSRDQLAAANARLAVLLAREVALARTDPHTGLPNLRSLLDHLRTEVARRRRDGRPLCLAYLDLDNFKLVNDHYGHAAGDELLQRIGTGIREVVRAGDVFARIGGDEFAVAFASAAPEDVENIARRLAACIRALGHQFPRADLGASIGIAWFAHPPADLDEVLGAADRAMYEAKSAGKGGVVLWRDDAAAGRVGAG